MKKFALVLAFLVFASVAIISVGSYGMDAADISLNKIASFSKSVNRIAVYGDKIALEVMEDSGYTDIYYSSGGSMPVDITNTPNITESRPAASSEGIAWERWGDNGDIWGYSSSIKQITSSPNNEYFPRIDGSKIVFVEDSSSGNFSGYIGIADIYSSSVYYLTTGFVDSPADISRDRVVYYSSGSGGVYVHYINNDTAYEILDTAEIVLISGDVVAYEYRSNFGKDVNVGFMNLRTGEDKVVWYSTVGYYGSLDSMDADGNFIVWSCDGSGYIYSISEDKVELLPLTDVRYVSVGGGYIGAITHGNEYDVWYGKLPQNLPYVEVILRSYEDANTTLMIKDSSGNIMGYCGGEFHNDIPGGKVLEDNSAMRKYRIESNNLGKYFYYVNANGNGHYDLKIYRMNYRYKGSVEQYVEAKWIEIKDGATHMYSVDWDKLANELSGAVTINIDEDGDGVFDKTAESSSPSIDQGTIDSAGGYSGSNVFSWFMENLLLIMVIVVTVVVIVVLVAVLGKRE